MAEKTRFVWRGRRRQKLRALQTAITRLSTKWDQKVKDAYRVFPPGAGLNCGTALTGRISFCLLMKEVVPKIPADAP